MPSTIKTSKLRSTKRLRRAEAYWTQSQMQDAVPIPFPTVSREMLRRATKGVGKTRIVQPVLPQSAKPVIASTVEVDDMTEFPFSYVGKLFMREGSSNFVGSAWVIGESAIFSAAHCMFDDNGTFFDDVVFEPQFKNGSSLGKFAVTQMSIDKRYAEFDDEHLNFDLGIGILDRPISHLTGIAGYAINPISQIAIGQRVTGIGYPAQSPFNGRKMFKSTGNIVRDSGEGTTNERFFGAENEMTGGCSGGPWVDGSNITIGLNSFVFRGERPPIMHSPYFGQGFENLIEWAQENGGISTTPPTDPDDDDDDSSTSHNNDRVKRELADVIEDLESLRDSLS